MRHSLAAVALAASALNAGCSALLDYSAFQSAGDDASVPVVDGGAMDGGESDAAAPDDASVDASVPVDAARDAGADASRPDASVPTDCETRLGDSYDIPLGEISSLPDPVANLPFDVFGNADGEVALAWVRPDGVARVRAWSVDLEARVAGDLLPEAAALPSVDVLLGAISVTRTSTGWLVLGRQGLAGRAALCTSGGCTSTPLDDGASSPFALAERGSNAVVVHTAPGAGFTSIWRASTIPPTSSTDLATAPGSLIPIDAVGFPTGFVALAGVEQSSMNRATFLWFDTPPAAGVQRSRSSLDPVGSLHVAYDTESETAIGVVTTVEADVARTNLITAQRDDTSAATRTTWAGNGGPVVSRGHGTFLVRESSGYSLRATADPATPLQQTGAPGGTSRPLVVGGRYAVLYISVGVPNEINLRVFPCE